MNPQDLVIHEDGLGDTIEEIQADIDFTVGQLELAYPRISELAEAWKLENNPAAKEELWQELLSWDAPRILLDNHLADQLRRLRELGE